MIENDPDFTNITESFLKINIFLYFKYSCIISQLNISLNNVNLIIYKKIKSFNKI